MMMNQIPQEINPLSVEQSQQFAQLMGTLSPVQQAWISGYLAATANGAVGAMPVAAPAVGAAPLTVLFGSQTGNAKHVAQDLAENAKARGLDVKLVDMADYKPNQLKTEKFIVVVVSTYGEGEPPEPAEKLHSFLTSKKAPKLDGVKVAVLGLGDSSYEFFCQTAIDFEDRFARLGAELVHAHALLDVDYDDHAPGWIVGAVDAFEPALKEQAEPASAPVTFDNAVAAPVSQYNKKNPFQAEISAVQKITGRDSTKDVRHVEISLDGSDLTYQAGDALGVYFHNDPAEVDEVISLLGVDPDAEVTIGDVIKPVRDALIEDLELTQSYPAFVEKYAAATGNAQLADLATDKTALRAYIEERQIFDILRDHPAGVTAQHLADCLRKIQPRRYSIASSQQEVEDEVHLTVGVVSFETFDRPHLGGCSGFLSYRVQEGSTVRVFVEHNNNFRLPDADTPVIMVGPGTGIAPFRSFLQDRDAAGAGGKNWLFFGNPHFTQDFLYQVELQSYLKSGLLTRLSVAFSRNQNRKVYVQDRLIEHGADVFAWLQEGAHFYICGDATRMAKDVHRALVAILKTHGDHSDDSAEAYLQDLRDSKRYQRDVY
ncbi:MAG: assimilatory sulfite reductase (NADPH) flavoprotein subunit [Pseudomonadota bacterium]